MKDRLIILDLCGGTGSWSKPFADHGYDVKNITLPEWDITDEKTIDYCCSFDVYGILFATDCTVWATSGARWFWERITAEVMEGFDIFIKGYRIINYHLIEGNLKFWAIENPVGKLRKFLGDPQLIFDPCDYGDPYTKKTLLWGNFKKPLVSPVTPIKGVHGVGTYRVSAGENRKEIRGTTPEGFANAFFEANKEK